MTARRNADGSPGPASFHCSKIGTGGCGSLRIAMPQLEKWVLAQTVSILKEVPMSAQEDDHSQEAALHRSIAQDDKALRQIQTDHYDGLLERPEFLDQRRRVKSRLEDSRQKLSDLTIDSVRSVLPGGPELAAQWPHQDAMWKRTMLSSVIDHITIKPFPKGVTSTLTRRRNESDEDLAERRSELLIKIMLERVHITWRV